MNRDRQMINMDESMFIVYAIDTPTYLSLVFGGTYAMPVHRPPQQCPVPGSTVALSGGLYRQTSPGGPAEVMAAGLIQVALETKGQRFGELALAALVEPDDPVTVVRSEYFQPSRAERVSMAQDLGFEAFEAGHSVVCQGKGSQLHRLRWLENTYAYDETSVFVGQRSPCPLQRSIAKRASSGENGIDLVREVWGVAHDNPGLIADTISGCRLVAGLGGVEGQDLFINRNETDTAGIEDSLKAIAKELGLALYYAGGNMDLESTDWFDAIDEWQPLPEAWVRKA